MKNSGQRDLFNRMIEHRFLVSAIPLTAFFHRAHWLGLAFKFSEQSHIFVLIDKLDFFDATKPSCVSELSVSP